MAVKAKETKQERLARITKKLKETDVGGGGKGFFSPKVGKNSIRILPEVGDMEFFFQEVGRHEFPDKKRVYCPKFTSASELECPVCELVKELYEAGDNASKKLAKSLRMRRSYWMNVINRNDEASGPLIYTPGVKAFDQISTIIGDPDYGDVTDAENGFDLTVERKGTGIETEYQVTPRRNSSPLGDSVDDWLQVAHDLTWVEVDEDPENDKKLSGDHAVYLLPYDRIVSEFGLDDIDVDAMLSSKEEDEEEEETPRRKSAAKAIERPARSVVKTEVEEEEVDEEEEETPRRKSTSPKEEVTRRARSRRR